MLEIERTNSRDIENMGYHAESNINSISRNASNEIANRLQRIISYSSSTEIETKLTSEEAYGVHEALQSAFFIKVTDVDAFNSYLSDIDLQTLKKLLSNSLVRVTNKDTRTTLFTGHVQHSSMQDISNLYPLMDKKEKIENEGSRQFAWTNGITGILENKNASYPLEGMFFMSRIIKDHRDVEILKSVLDKKFVTAEYEMGRCISKRDIGVDKESFLNLAALKTVYPNKFKCLDISDEVYRIRAVKIMSEENDFEAKSTNLFVYHSIYDGYKINDDGEWELDVPKTQI